MTEARVDQQVREAEIQETPAARVDQLTREARVTDSTIAARVDQQVREAEIVDTTVNARVDQLVREVWVSVGRAYVNQLVREVWVPPPPEPVGDQPYLNVEQVPQGDYPTQLLVTAPNGTVYALQIATIVPPQLGQPAQGILQVALPVTIPGCDTSISVLADRVQQRLEEPIGAGIFWNRAFEIYTGLAEAENDLLMLIGRPTQTVSVPFTLEPNTVWQRVPKGIFLISDIQGAQSQLRKVTLFDLDYSQSSWGADWENDTDDAGPLRWAPVGMTMFAVHPAPTVPTQVTLDAIAYPIPSSAFPYTGTEIVPFHHEIFSALEEYAAVYLRMKEMGPEFMEAMGIYQNYLTMASRLTEIEDRRDPMIFARAFGAPAGVQSRTKR